MGPDTTHPTAPCKPGRKPAPPALPGTFLLWQHATPFIMALTEPLKVLAPSRTHFHAWANRYGVSLHSEHLPWLQLRPIPWNTYPFQGTSCKVFLVLRKQALAHCPSLETLQTLPA